MTQGTANSHVCHEEPVRNACLLQIYRVMIHALARALHHSAIPSRVQTLPAHHVSRPVLSVLPPAVSAWSPRSPWSLRHSRRTPRSNCFRTGSAIRRTNYCCWRRLGSAMASPWTTPSSRWNAPEARVPEHCDCVQRPEKRAKFVEGAMASSKRRGRMNLINDSDRHLARMMCVMAPGTVRRVGPVAGPLPTRRPRPTPRRPPVGGWSTASTRSLDLRGRCPPPRRRIGTPSADRHRGLPRTP